MTDATELDEAAMRKAAERSLNTGDWWDPRDLREALDRIADVGDDTRADAEYIWQVRPAKILAALDEITRLRAALDEARAEVERLASYAEAYRRAHVCTRECRPNAHRFMLGRIATDEALARAEAAEKERDEARAEVERLKSPERDTTGLTYGDKAAWRHLIARAETAESALSAVRKAREEWIANERFYAHNGNAERAGGLQEAIDDTAALATPTTTDEGDDRG